jgi:hypothetical protein
MNPVIQAYHMGRASCWHGRHMIDDIKFGYLMQTVGPIRGLILMINWRHGWRDAARGL